MQDRINWIDAVKGTCLFLVVIAHLWSPCPLWTHVLTGGYMQVFFVMAGITSIRFIRSFREQIISKCKRILLPYAFYGITLLLLGVILPKHIEFGRGILGLLYGRYMLFPPSAEVNFPLLQACGYLSPFWFLPCIFFSYILLAWYDHSKRPYLIVVLAICVSIASPLLPILLPWSIEMAFIGFLLMICGRGLHGILFNPPALFNRHFHLFLLWIGSAIVYMIAWEIDGPVNMSLSVIGSESMFFPFRFIFFILLGVSEALFLSLLFRALNTSAITRCFAYIGRHALRLLCIHLFIGECIYFLLADRDLPKIVSFMCALLVIFIIDYILEHYSLIILSLFGQKTSGDIPAKKH